MPQVNDKLAPLAARMMLLERALQESQGLQRLSQVVTCRGEKAGFGAIGQFCRFPRARNLLLEPLPLGNVGRQAMNARRLSGRVELGDSNLLKPHFASAIRSQVAERHRVRGLLGMSTVYAFLHLRTIVRMDLSQPLSTVENLVRFKAEDFLGIWTVPHPVRREVPIERHHTAEPKCLFEPTFPLQNSALVKPPLAKQRRKDQRGNTQLKDPRLIGQIDYPYAQASYHRQC